MDVEKLIELVRNYPIVYDTSHDDYMRTKLKDEVWEKIGNELNTNEIKLRMSNPIDNEALRVKILRHHIKVPGDNEFRELPVKENSLQTIEKMLQSTDNSQATVETMKSPIPTQHEDLVDFASGDFSTHRPVIDNGSVQQIRSQLPKPLRQQYPTGSKNNFSELLSYPLMLNDVSTQEASYPSMLNDVSTQEVSYSSMLNDVSTQEVINMGFMENDTTNGIFHKPHTEGALPATYSSNSGSILVYENISDSEAESGNDDSRIVEEYKKCANSFLNTNVNFINNKSHLVLKLENKLNLYKMKYSKIEEELD